MKFRNGRSVINLVLGDRGDRDRLLGDISGGRNGVNGVVTRIGPANGPGERNRFVLSDIDVGELAAGYGDHSALIGRGNTADGNIVERCVCRRIEDFVLGFGGNRDHRRGDRGTERFCGRSDVVPRRGAGNLVGHVDRLITADVRIAERGGFHRNRHIVAADLVGQLAGGDRCGGGAVILFVGSCRRC